MTNETEQEILVLKAKVLDMSYRLSRLQTLHGPALGRIDGCIQIVTRAKPRYRIAKDRRMTDQIRKRLLKARTLMAEMGGLL